MSENKLRDLLLEKVASKKKEARFGLGGLMSLGGRVKATGQSINPVFRNALLLGGAGALIGGGAAAAQNIGSAIADPLKKRVGYKRMLRENDYLQREDPSAVGKIYDTLFRFSPTMAMDPLVSGSFMKKQLEFQDVGVQPNDLQTISNIEKAVKDRAQHEIIRSAFNPGNLANTMDLV
jgi:hypothetical protein